MCYMDPIRFEFTLDSATGGGVKIPYDIKSLAGKAKPPVKVTINGHSYRSTVAVYSGEYFVPLRKSNAEAAHIEADVPFEVLIELDDEPRVVEVPDDLAAALDLSAVRQKWEKLSYSHQREYVEAIEDAKKPETRARRIAKTVEALQ